MTISTGECVATIPPFIVNVVIRIILALDETGTDIVNLILLIDTSARLESNLIEFYKSVEIYELKKKTVFVCKLV